MQQSGYEWYRITSTSTSCRATAKEELGKEFEKRNASLQGATPRPYHMRSRLSNKTISLSFNAITWCQKQKPIHPSYGSSGDCWGYSSTALNALWVTDCVPAPGQGLPVPPHGMSLRR